MLVCLSGLAVLSCNQQGATGSPGTSSPVVSQSTSNNVVSISSVATFSAHVSWSTSHSAGVNSTGGGYQVYIYAGNNSSAPHGPRSPSSLATVANGQLASGMINPIDIPFNTNTAAPQACTWASSGTMTCALTGLTLHSPFTYWFYVYAYQTNTATVTASLTAGSTCATFSSTAGFTVGMKVTDVTIPAALTSGTTIGALPGTCAYGQVQLSQAALGTLASQTMNVTWTTGSPAAGGVALEEP